MALVVYFKTSREYLQEVLNSFREKKPRLTFAVYGIVCTVMLTALVLSYAIFLPHHGSRGTKHVVIVPGMGSRMIGAFLKQEGVIGSKWAFVIYVSLRGDASDLKPGAYEFPDTAAIPAIARDLVAGESHERIITIPEGWSNADIAEYFKLQGIAGRDEAMSFMKAPSDDIVSLLEPLGASRKSSGTEGYLFPDTYRIFRDAGLADITGKMVRNFDAKVTQEVRDAIAGQQKSIFEIVIMASLIEKEVSSEEDRALVSGILWKRISLGMPLQVDATIAYIKNKESRIKNQRDGKISLEDTKIDSPYNTYRYRGLPRGPIANPGLSAIRAAVFPRSSPYLYYLSTPDGRTIFSRTLEEHNAAKEKYLR